MPELDELDDPFLDKTEHDIPPAQLPYGNEKHAGCLNDINGTKNIHYEINHHECC